jgi:methyl-accepting chemotaxis protein
MRRAVRAVTARTAILADGGIAQSGELISEAVEQAKMTNDRIQGLTEAAEKIGTVVSFITGIAAQTNLLALNATIEAARAGEAGKGFAVVASEVKTLATQTAKATEDIAKQIAGIQLATKESAKSIQGITLTIDRVNETSSAIAAAVEQQGSATQEISRNASEAANGTKEVSNNILNVKIAAQVTGSSASQVLSAASRLSQDGEDLKAQVENFLSKVRMG